MERIHYRREESVLCSIQIDSEFLRDIREIAEKKKALNQTILGNEDAKIEKQEYEIIHQKATRHSQANILNVSTSKDLKDILDEKRCTCGCGKGIGELLPFCSSEQSLSILGSGIILFFFYLRHIRMLMVLMFMIYGAFAITTYLTFGEYSQENCLSIKDPLLFGFCIYNQHSTFARIVKNQFLMQIQLWLGFFMCILWMVGLKFITTLGLKKDRDIDDSLDSASDYTIKIDNLPYGQYDEFDLIDYLNQLWTDYPSQLQFKSIQIIYNMEEYEKMIQQLFILSEKLMSYMEKNHFRFSNTIKNDKVQAYKAVKYQIIKKIGQLQEHRKQFKLNRQIRMKKSTTIAFLEFVTSQQKVDFLKTVQSRKNPIQDTFMPNNTILFKNCSLNISRAPEPSDIMWSNCQKAHSYFRTVIIWLMTVLILYIGYALISYIQTLDFVKAMQGIITSIILQLFNRVIWLQLSWLVTYEYNNTKTESIISLMKKSMIAQAMNIIITPVISKFVNNKSLYGDQGLSSMTLTYQFVMVVMMLFYYILNPVYISKWIAVRIPCLRNCLIRRYCQIVGTIVTIQEIKQVLKFYEGPQFPVAGGFVFMTTAIFHALFFCHLQPIILIYVSLNMTIFFFIMKYMLFRRCKIPELTNVQVFQFAMFAISYGAVFYGVGSMFFLIIDDNLIIKDSIHLLVPSILCIILWFLTSLNVFNVSDAINNFLINAISSANKKSKQIKKKDFRQTINVQRLDEQMTSSIIDLQVWSRRQSYYRQCNTNKLFEFESYLLQTLDQFRSRRGHPLRRFCESFFNRKITSKFQESQMAINNRISKIDLIPVVLDR